MICCSGVTVPIKELAPFDIGGNEEHLRRVVLKWSGDDLTTPMESDCEPVSESTRTVSEKGTRTSLSDSDSEDRGCLAAGRASRRAEAGRCCRRGRVGVRSADLLRR